jgi:excinuclease ABC subunit B
MAETATPSTTSGAARVPSSGTPAIAPDELLLDAAPASNYAARDDARFRVVSDFEPAGDQPAAIAALSTGIDEGQRFQTLLGITGSGKSCNDRVDDRADAAPDADPRPEQVACSAARPRDDASSSPTIVSSTSSAITTTTSPRRTSQSIDTYIEKDSSINDEIDRLRHSATAALLTRRDVIVVASVSCIYGMGDPEEYRGQPARTQRQASTTTCAASCVVSSTCSSAVTT